MLCDPNDADPINSYALVSYLPSPLGEFLDKLRQALVAGCVAQSHVTVLPPRELADVEAAKRAICRGLENFSPFELSIGEVSVFPGTHVIYLEIMAGRGELLRLHAGLNSGPLQSAETFEYHPHITLAQGFDVDKREALREYARREWAGYQGPRSFTVDTLLFVQNTSNNLWIDLMSCELPGAREAFTR